jgi:hypothetical protein
MKDILIQLGFHMFHSDCVTPALAEFPVRFTPFHHVARYFGGAVVNYSPVVEFDGEISAVFRIDIGAHALPLARLDKFNPDCNRILC